MNETQTNLPGTGYQPKERTAQTRVMLAFAAAEPIYDWNKAPVEDGDPEANAFGVPDKDQGSSLTCTAQTGRYGFFKKTGITISVKDIYSRTQLPGGGAFLDAPYYYITNFGHLLLEHYPEPEMPSEEFMSQLVVIKDGFGRIRKFRLDCKISPVVSVDAAAAALDQFDFVALGIAGSWNKGWHKSWTDPEYQKQNAWQHAIMTAKGGAVWRKGKRSIKCKSSWTKHFDFLGKQNFVHYINEDYFNNGGVFEILGVTVKELDMPNQKFTIKIGDALGVIQITPDGDLAGEIAGSPKEYSEMGKKFGIKTCDIDSAGNPVNFGPVNFTKTA